MSKEETVETTEETTEENEVPERFERMAEHLLSDNPATLKRLERVDQEDTAEWLVDRINRKAEKLYEKWKKENYIDEREKTTVEHKHLGTFYTRRGKKRSFYGDRIVSTGEEVLFERELEEDEDNG